MAKPPAEDALVAAFLTRTLRESTQRTYGWLLREYLAWLRTAGVGHVADVSTPHLHLYAQHLEQRGNSVNTRASKQRVVSRFYAYLVEVGTIRNSPVPLGWAPKNVPAARIPTLSESEIDLLYEASRDHARFLDVGLLIALAGWDGVKLEHIVGFSADSVRFSPGGLASVPVHRKDGTVHHRQLSQRSSEHLATVIAGRSAELLFYPDVPRGSAVTGRARRALSSVAKSARIEGGLSARRLERSYRARVVEGGIPMETVLESLGLSVNGATHHRHTTLPQFGPETEGFNSRDRAVHELDALELLRQAEVLCDQGGVTPIAPIVIAGAALEMVLRRMCEEQEVETTVRQPGINAYADALRRRSLLSKHAHAQILANGKLRNDAAHGVSSCDVSIPNARHMIRSVALFLGGQED